MDEHTAGWLCPFLPSSMVRIRRLVEMLALTESDHVLDIGAGNGAALIEVARLTGCTCTGVELDQGLVEEAREAAAALGLGDRCRFVCGDATKVVVAPSEASGQGEGCVHVATVTVVLLYLIPSALVALEEVVRGVMARGSSARLCTLVYHYRNVAYDQADPDFNIAIMDSGEPFRGTGRRSVARCVL